MHNQIIKFIREKYQSNDAIPLHAPLLDNLDSEYVSDALNSGYVSSIGAYVDRLEGEIALYLKSPGAIACATGTAALHISLLLAKTQPGDLVITQALTFVATCNAISYCNASPIFVDVDSETLSLSPDALSFWLNENAILDSEGRCRLASTLQIIRACVPVHTFGHPAKLNELNAICSKWNLVLIEDAAESFGSVYEGRHTGTFGQFGCVSFNGNKIITGGGGGAIISNKINAMQAKHLTTTAKIPHEYEFSHDSIGYNYRLPNLNAALVLAQLKKINFFLNAKRLLAKDYETFFSGTNLKFMREPANCKSNYWLNTIFCGDQKERDFLLRETNSQGIMTRPIWKLMCDLPMFKDCLSDGLKNSKYFQSIAINLPSGVPRHELSKLIY